VETSDKQKQASRENGKHGGVKTKEGKAKSSQNSLKHGIFSNLATKYDIVDFQSVYSGFAEEFGDTTPSRQVLIEQLSLCYIRLLRCARYESDKIKEALNPPKYEKVTHGFADLEYREELKLVAANDKAPVDDEKINSLDIIYFRYEPHIYKRFLELIEKLRSEV